MLYSTQIDVYDQKGDIDGMRFLLHVKCFFQSSQKTRDWEQLLLSFTSGYAEDLCPASGWAQKIGCQCCFCWFFSYYSWDWEAPIGCSSGLLRLPREDSEIQVKIEGSFGSSFELLLQVDSWKKSFVTLHQMAKCRLNSHETVTYLFTPKLILCELKISVSGNCSSG